MLQILAILVSQGDCHNTIRSALLAIALLFCFASFAILLSYVMNVPWNIPEWRYLFLVLGTPLALGLLMLRFNLAPSFSSLMTLLSLITLMSLLGGAIAMLGTRSPVDIADPWLAAADRTLFISATDFVVQTQRLPAWAISTLVKAYLHTGSIFIWTLILFHLVNREQLAWRILLIWGWSFLAIALLSFAAPAIGCFSQLSNEDVAHLPKGAGRYAIRIFNEFRSSADPLLETRRIGGVITFPSLHAVTAMMIAQAWHGFQVLGTLTKMLTAVIVISCVPIGGHYVVDLIAGMAVWWVTVMAVDRIVNVGQRDGTSANKAVTTA